MHFTKKFVSVRFVVSGLLLTIAWLGGDRAAAQAGTGTFRVDVVTGIDNGSCGSVAAPCESIQQAVNLASGGDTILVAKGTYVYDAALDTLCTPVVGKTGVVCVLNKDLTILGGYTTGNWATADPAANPTVIDGEDLHRGVFVQTGPADPETTFRMEGFTVTRGFQKGSNSGPDIDTFAFGGGFNATLAHVILRDMTFTGNESAGGDTAAAHGGAGAGGGVAILANAGRQLTALLERITFDGNVARGGTGPDRGGLALGGALFVNFTNLQGNDLTFTDNRAFAGSSSGAGLSQGLSADAQGGAAAFGSNSLSVLDGVVASGNQGHAGDAAGQGGQAVGGSFFVELGNLTLRDTEIRSNAAYGGDGDKGGTTTGGGIATTAATLTLDRVFLVDNFALGGFGTTTRGAAGGGGAGFNDTGVTATNCLVTDNVVQEGGGGAAVGGGGGGFFLTGGTSMDMSHCTFARNRLVASPLGGHAIILVTAGVASTANIRYTTIADHTDWSGNVVALHVQPGSTATLTNELFAGNLEDTNADGTPAVGTINGLASMLRAASVDFVSPGPPDFDYHLLASSPAIDQATGSTETLDFDQETRTGTPDVGHDEFGGLIFGDGFESGNTSAWSTTVGGS